MTDTMIETPDGQVLNNGDNCPDGRMGNILLKVNGTPERAIASYVPRDNDILELRFEGKSINKQPRYMSNLTRLFSLT